MIDGKVACDRMTFSQTQNQLKQSLAPLNEHLLLRNFLVGHSLTIADALLVSTLARCYELVLDKKSRDSALPNLSRYAMLILKMGPFARVFGAVTFCKDMTQPSFSADKSQPKQQQQQKPQQQSQKGGAEGGIQVSIRTVSKGTKQVSVQGSDTVQSLKESLGEAAVEGTTLRLLCQGKALADDSKIEACQIKAGATIFAVRCQATQ
mmetsp:Transcript_28565/g.35334  ORF Transcript_28565/g.35334 Transcript_28565/m.35334 type:complete len:207 (+) Transcript_28565:360-980(+)